MGNFSKKDKNLVIVESPTKAKTIQKFLGEDFSVYSSYGHVRDLPKNKFGIDVENNFEPKYIIIPRARKTIKFLKEKSEAAKDVILATDEDREGESIAYHLKEVLKIENYQRIVFHEITKRAIEEALKNPRKIDMNLVYSQFARRVLDRIVGYKLSPFLWKKVARRLSAGRVQSVAVRLVVEREREIQAFVSQEYWTIVATLLKIKNQKSKIKNNEFEAILIKKDGKTIPKFGIKTKKEAEGIVKDLKGAEFQVENIQRKEIKKNPLPPFITSTLQQTAWQILRFPAKRTMSLAQNLYEQGFITYHRTDSLNLSSLALSQARNFIEENFGKNYWQFRKFKTKSKVAQEAHEAIRPTNLKNTPQALENKLQKDQLRLYDLIFRRFIATQMKEAIFDSVSVNIQAKNYQFLASGQTLKFDGFLKVYPLSIKETQLPVLEVNEILEAKKITPIQHFTQPPPRYTEATLIKVLEENGIGRPSTYASIISTIQERNYVEKDEKRRFKPTEIGMVVNDLLVKHFPDIVDIKFTAQMEEKLDEIAQGKEKWTEVIRRFYVPFEKNLKQKEQVVSKKDIAEEKTDKICPKCGSPIIIKLGKFGRFYACTNFPKCKYTESLEENQLKVKCPKCESGEIIEKRTRRGKTFYACNKYPNCDFAVWDKPIEETCPKCGWPQVKTKRGQVKCSNPECKDKSSSN
jgi:DNA topoisomerase-1